MTKQQSLPWTRVTETGCIPQCLTAALAGLLLTMLPLLTGCGGGSGSGDGQASTPADTGITASLTWDPIPDPLVNAYFVYYGRQSPGHPGSCVYESSMHVPADSPSAIVTNLEPNTRYYFTVSAYNGLESACSAEASTVTPPTPV
ncbi:MAG: fibronectin type III domain-containing protein [Nitrospirae bacterium]|nr:fibronectin type III domain-containing protein [Nitrospirota bacterium]